MAVRQTTSRGSDYRVVNKRMSSFEGCRYPPLKGITSGISKVC